MILTNSSKSNSNFSFFRQQEIEKNYLYLRGGQKFRKTLFSCFIRCGGELIYPFSCEPIELGGKQVLCFSDCVNVNLEKGPFMKDFGSYGEDVIPKKFVWTYGENIDVLLPKPE